MSFNLRQWGDRLRSVVATYMTFEILVRVAADVLIVNACYLLGLMLRMLYGASFGEQGSIGADIRHALLVFGATSWLLTLISLTCYAVTGFYTRTRFYRGRYKALAIVQAVTASYLVFGAALYALQAFGPPVEPPRLGLVLSWLLTVVATLGARLWGHVWRQVVQREAPRTAVATAARSSLPARNILVIGGAGYIGSVLCRELLSSGYYVRVLDALLYGRDSVEPLLDHPRFELVEADSRDLSAVCRAMLGMDSVVHLGEIVGDPACSVDKKLTLQVNVAATRMIAEIAKGFGVGRFIYASSCSVYGANDDVLDERSELNPISLYAKAKVASERVLLGLNGSDFHPVILRFATVFGLSPRPRFDLVVNLLAAMAARDRQITVYGGDQWRPFVHVVDVAQAIVQCIKAPVPNIKAQIFNVGSNNNNHTILEVARMVCELVPGTRLIVEESEKDPRNYKVCFTKIERELAFKATRSVRDGVAEIVQAMRDGVIQDPSDKRYNNLRTFTDPENHLVLRWQPAHPLFVE